MTKRLNEGFVAEESHREATTPEEFLQAAEILEAGGTFQQAIDMLSPQHLTSLFHVEHRPPLAMLMDRTRKEQIEVLRDLAAKLDPEP